MAVAPQELARDAGLRYVYDSVPGYRRRRAGRGFTYIDTDGAPLRDDRELARIRALAIPPAWTEVWICPSPNGHLQATGRDAKGRKQYRYHDRWRAVSDETKFHRMLAFAQALPKIRRAVERDLRREGLPRERVLATIVSLLDRTFLRIGNEGYAKENGSYGLTTLRGGHVKVAGARIRFAFRGKSGKQISLDVEHPRCARVIRRCRDLPGYRLFRYVDDSGELHDVDSGEVNEYLREISGGDFTAKDFRTWAGTVLFARAAHDAGVGASQRDATRRLNAAVAAVAEMLNNTPAVCRASYIHPAFMDAYRDGTLAGLREACAGARCARLRPDEALTLSMLRRMVRRTRASSGARAA